MPPPYTAACSGSHQETSRRAMMRMLIGRFHDHLDEGARHTMQLGASVTLRPPVTPQLANRLGKCCLHRVQQISHDELASSVLSGSRRELRAGLHVSIFAS